VDTVYRDFPPRIGIYPIDGSFLDISDVRQRDREFLARDMRATVSGGGPSSPVRRGSRPSVNGRPSSRCNLCGTRPGWTSYQSSRRPGPGMAIGDDIAS
jgi:hypothetical protein